MAKVKGIYSTKLAGTVGSVVYRNTVNGNIVSEKAANVSNPRTVLQQIQRAIFNSVIQSYSILKGIDDHAFAGVNGSAKNMAKFLAINLSAVRTYVENNDGIHSDIDDIGDTPSGMVQRTGTFVPAIDNVITVSKGTLSSAISYAEADAPILPIQSGSEYSVNWYGANVINSSGESLTYGEILDGLGVSAGDQLTLIAVAACGYQETVSGNALSDAKLYKGYAILNSEMARTTVITGDNIDSIFETNNLTLSGVEESEHVEPILTLSTGNDIPYMFALIRSQKVDDVWDRSTEKLACNTEFLLASSSYLPRTWYEVLQSYDPSSVYYLNNAE